MDLDSPDFLSLLVDDDDDNLMPEIFEEAHALEIAGPPHRPGGSTVGRAMINHGHLHWHRHLFQDYFAESSTFRPKLFRRCFRMQQPLFLYIVSEIGKHNDYFIQKRDATMVLGLSPIQKATVAIRQLAYGTLADSLMNTSTLVRALLGRAFCASVKALVLFLVLSTCVHRLVLTLRDSWL
jgi:hypothetical protein